MNGKIFKESTNLYQDQARILFDFYKDKAEKIIGEEERLEKEISIAKEARIQIETVKKKLKLYQLILFIGGGLFVLASLFFIDFPLFYLFLLVGIGAIVFGIIQLLKGKKIKKEAMEIDKRIMVFNASHKEIFRDYKVTKLGVGYIPVACRIPFEDKSFIIDYTGTNPEEEFKLQIVNQSELLISKISELESLITTVPMVEKSDEVEVVDTEDYSRSIQKVVYHDYFGKLDRNLRTSAYCMDDLNITSVSLPVILPNSDYHQYLKDHATTDIGRFPVFEPFDVTKYKDDIDRFNSLNEMKKSLERHSVQFEEVLKSLIVNMAASVQAITKLKVVSANKLVDQSNQILFKILKASYNYYSPVLESEEIDRIKNERFDFQDSVESYQPFQLRQSSRVKYDLLSELWVAEDGSKTNFPFGMHQIHEEIVAPIVQNLLQETRLERLKIYNNIKDQKINYLNKWHQDTEDFYARNRAESNELINLMRSTLSEYIAAFNTLSALENTEKSMTENVSLDSTVVETVNNSAEVLTAFESKSKEFQNVQTEFTEYMERLKEDIERKAEKFEYIEYFDASLRDSSPKNMAVATGRMHELDPRRRPLVAVNPLYAETSELLPEPNIEDVTYEHMSMNLSVIARTALNDLNEELQLQKLGINNEIDTHIVTVVPGDNNPGQVSPDTTTDTLHLDTTPDNPDSSAPDEQSEENNSKF